jgi:hypothetical protein
MDRSCLETDINESLVSRCLIAAPRRAAVANYRFMVVREQTRARHNRQEQRTDGLRLNKKPIACGAMCAAASGGSHAAVYDNCLGPHPQSAQVFVKSHGFNWS